MGWDDEKAEGRRGLWRAAKLLAAFGDLDDQRLVLRPEVSLCLEEQIVGLVQYAAYRERHSFTRHENDDATARELMNAILTAPGNHTVATPEEAAFIGALLGIEAYHHLECAYRAAPNCLATTNTGMSVYRRHSGARNYYALNKVIEHHYLDARPPRIFHEKDHGPCCHYCAETIGDPI